MELTARDGSRSRCAYCHDRLGGRHVACPRCGTLLHKECVAEKCPTYGCAHTFARILVRVVPRPQASLGCGFFLGVILPVLALLLNEAGIAREFVHGIQALPRVLYIPELQRLFYPLLGWAMAALIAENVGRRAAWVRVGLWGGVLLALAFSIAYAPLLPISCVGVIFMGLGLLGFTPYVAFFTYLNTAVRYESAQVDEVKASRRETLGYTAVWSLLALGGAALARAGLEGLMRAVPPPPHSECYLATVAAQGDPRVTGAVPVRFGERTVLVSRQLRRFKAFEVALMGLAPSLHRVLRFVYDRVGPRLAARLGRRSGTVLHVAFMPAELGVALVLRLLFAHPERLERAVYPPSYCGGTSANAG